MSGAFPRLKRSTMTGEYKAVKKVSRHNGIFGDFEMIGFQYEDDLGDRAWHVTAWRLRNNPINDFWVHDKDFYSLKIQLASGPLAENLFQIVGKFDDSAIPADEKQAILQAIESWSREWQDCLKEAEQSAG